MKWACDSCMHFVSYGIYGKFCPHCGLELKEVIE